VTLAAKLSANDGTPARGEQVVFYELSSVFGERLMKLGSAMTDVTGTASLPYEPTWKGQHTVVVRYGGDSEYTPAQTTFRFQSTAPPHVHQNARFGLEAPRKWAPLGVGLAVLAVWGVLGLALVRTVVGIAGAAPATDSSTAFWTPRRSLHPVSLGPALLSPLILALAALTAAALFVGLVLPRTHGSEAGLAAPVAQSGANDAQSNVLAAQVMPAATSGGSDVQGGRGVAARVIQSIPAFSTDEEGNLTPNSPDLPAGVAVVNDHVFVLDTNHGRVLAVTADGQLARTFESDPDGQTSVAHALAMTTHEGQLYVAAPLFGNIVQLSTAGHVDGVIQPLLPKAAHPFRPAGIAVTDQGDIWLSDSANHRVVLVSGSGVLLATIGRAAAASGSEDFDTPGGIALDGSGHLWVVDTGTHEVKEYSPQGTLLSTIGHDALSMPRDVAVDEGGHVFVTDQALREVRVFGTDGALLGSIGKSDGTAGGPSDSGLQYPSGIEINGDRLFVMDRLSGMFVFQLEAP
jgi:sugar lactone lactonase YvrE